MSLREEILDYLAIKPKKDTNLEYNKGLLENPFDFFNYQKHVASNHYVGKIYFQNGKPLTTNTDYFNNPANDKDTEEHTVYLKEQPIPLRMHAEVLYSHFINKAGGTSVIYYPYTSDGCTGVISKDLRAFKKADVMEFEDLCPLQKCKNNDDGHFQSYSFNMEQFEQLQSKSIMQSFLNLFLIDMSVQQFDRHNKNFLIVKDANDYELVALDNDVTKATLSSSEKTVFNNGSTTYVKGIYHYIEPYQQVIDALLKDKKTGAIISDKKTARKTLSLLNKTSLEDVANDIYRQVGFSVDDNLVKKSQVAKEKVCNDLDRCL